MLIPAVEGCRDHTKHMKNCFSQHKHRRHWVCMGKRGDRAISA